MCLQVLVELFVELHITVRCYIEHTVTAVALVDVIDVLEAVRAEVSPNEVTHLTWDGDET